MLSITILLYTYELRLVTIIICSYDFTQPLPRSVRKARALFFSINWPAHREE